MSIFQSISGLNGLSKDIAFTKRRKIAVESFCSFPKEIQKREQIQDFFWLIINPFDTPASLAHH